MTRHDPDREREVPRRQPGVSGDLVPALRALRDGFGADQVEVLDVTANPLPPRQQTRRREDRER